MATLLSRRLQTVADQVPQEGVLADIGTDHALLPIYLVENGRISRAYACDVRPGPLSRAKERIHRAGQEDKIQTILSDGFEKIPAGEVTTAVIAGMGGRLTADIIMEESMRTKNVLADLKSLILQPQSEWELARHALHNCGFAICHEEMLEERGLYYIVIRAVPGQESYSSEQQYIYGCHMAGRDPVFREYLQKEKDKIQNVFDRLDRAGATDQVLQRMSQLREKIRELEEVLQKWQ